MACYGPNFRSSRLDRHIINSLRNKKKCQVNFSEKLRVENLNSMHNFDQHAQPITHEASVSYLIGVSQYQESILREHEHFN
jgi:hypothetical protein